MLVTPEQRAQSLFQAIALKNAPLAISLIPDANLNCTFTIGNTSGISCLHLASALGFDTVANKLIEAHHRLDMIDNKHWSALHYAAQYGHVSILKLLKDEGAKISPEEPSFTPLHVTAQFDQLEAGQFIYDWDPSLLETVTDDGDTPLHIASIFNSPKMLGFLNSCYGVNPCVNKSNARGDYPLHLLLLNQPTPAVLEQMIETGADVHHVNAEGLRPSQLAALFDLHEATKILRQREIPLFALCCETVAQNPLLFQRAQSYLPVDLLAAVKAQQSTNTLPQTMKKQRLK